jgi:hypothetical protein
VEAVTSLEVIGVFRGRELTRKDRKLTSGIESIDYLLGGGIVRGRISELIGPTGAGKTSLALAFATRVTRYEVAAWIEAGNSLDPFSTIAAGIDPARLLWVSCRTESLSKSLLLTADGSVVQNGRRQRPANGLKVAEWILAAGGFGLVVIDLASDVRFIPISAVLRLARAAEQSGAAVIVMAERRVCGTFAALSLRLKRKRNCFNRTRVVAPATFEGNEIEAQIMRNKLGGVGASAVWRTTTDPIRNCPIPAWSSCEEFPPYSNTAG